MYCKVGLHVAGSVEVWNIELPEVVREVRKASSVRAGEVANAIGDGLTETRSVWLGRGRAVMATTVQTPQVEGGPPARVGTCRRCLGPKARMPPCAD